MRGGDISNRIAPRLWFVFEGLLVLPDGRPLNEIVREWHRIRLRRPKLQHYFVLNNIVVKRMWDLTWRFDFHTEVVTFEAAWLDDAAAWMDAIDLPCSVHAMDDEGFHDVVLSPAVARVYDPDPHRTLRWGSKGFFVDPHYDFEPLS